MKQEYEENLCLQNIFFLLVLGFWAGGITKVFASPPAPAPKCNIEGVIKDARFEKAYESECLTHLT